MQYQGMEIQAVGWGLFLLIAGGWLASAYLLVPLGRDGWTAIPKSLFGYAWLGFGVLFIVRFLLLAYDSVAFGNLTPRLALIPVEVVQFTLFLSGAFWLCFVAGFAAGRRRHGRGAFATLSRFTPEIADRPFNIITLVSTICILLATGLDLIPMGLTTLLTHLGALWVVPAAMVWWRSREAGRLGKSGALRRWALLLPGAILGALSPFREHIVNTIVVPCVSALYAGWRPKWTRVSAVMALILLVSTLVIGGLRDIYWRGMTLQEAVEIQQRMLTMDWNVDSVFADIVRRFHGFDSFLLTVDRVPRLFSFSQRNLLMELAVRIGIPRMVYPEKEGSDRGLEFAKTIWGYGEPVIAEAHIAPSMPGDLYSVGGAWFVVIGGFFWGLLVGVLEGWKSNLAVGHQATVTSLFAIMTAAGCERDFVHTIGTYAQLLILLFLLMALLPVARDGRLAGKFSRRRVGQAKMTRESDAGTSRIVPPLC
jgi:hypothetical protein